MKSNSLLKLLALPILLSLAGVASLLLGLVNYASEQAWFSRAKQAQATITAYDVFVDAEDDSSYCPRVEFTTQAGAPATSHSGSCLSRPDESQIGKTITVYYNPDNPSETRTKGWAGSEGSGLILGVLGLIFFPALGWGGLLVERLGARARARKRAGRS